MAAFFIHRLDISHQKKQIILCLAVEMFKMHLNPRQFNKIIVATLHVSYLPLFGHLGEVLFLKQDNHLEIKEKLANSIGVSSKPL